MNFNHVRGDCYVSFNDIQWLLIKVTGQRQFQRHLSRILSPTAPIPENFEAYVVTTLPVMFGSVNLSCEC